MPFQHLLVHFATVNNDYFDNQVHRQLTGPFFCDHQGLGQVLRTFRDCWLLERDVTDQLGQTLL